MTDKILVKMLSMDAGKKLACISLNKPKALNALDLDMVQAMHKHLLAWRNDDDIAAVFIDSVGEKAFCAGGDIVSMYQAMVEHKLSNEPPAFLAQFFKEEYTLDYQLHTYGKPVICWGNGIIMGGGLGVFAGASTKIVTQHARVAMPEISIGLFPDVGASYFLNKMPPGVGKFLGLSGASINAADCIDISLANYFIQAEHKEAFIANLLSADALNQSVVDSLCAEFDEKAQATSQLVGNLSAFMHDLAPLDNIKTAEQAETFISELAETYPDSKLMQRAYASLKNGSPITAHLVMQQLQRSKHFSLANCFCMELSMAYTCSVSGEFQEGVRALLIDKDNAPKWRYNNINSVPETVISEHFNQFSSAGSSHPLANLGSDFGENNAK